MSLGGVGSGISVQVFQGVGVKMTVINQIPTETKPKTIGADSSGQEVQMKADRNPVQSGKTAMRARSSMNSTSIEKGSVEKGTQTRRKLTKNTEKLSPGELKSISQQAKKIVDQRKDMSATQSKPEKKSAESTSSTSSKAINANKTKLSDEALIKQNNILSRMNPLNRQLLFQDKGPPAPNYIPASPEIESAVNLSNEIVKMEKQIKDLTAKDPEDPQISALKGLVNRLRSDWQNALPEGPSAPSNIPNPPSEFAKNVELGPPAPKYIPKPPSDVSSSKAEKTETGAKNEKVGIDGRPLNESEISESESDVESSETAIAKPGSKAEIETDEKITEKKSEKLGIKPPPKPKGLDSDLSNFMKYLTDANIDHKQLMKLFDKAVNNNSLIYYTKDGLQVLSSSKAAAYAAKNPNSVLEELKAGHLKDYFKDKKIYNDKLKISSAKYEFSDMKNDLITQTKLLYQVIDNQKKIIDHLVNNKIAGVSKYEKAQIINVLYNPDEFVKNLEENKKNCLIYQKNLESSKSTDDLSIAMTNSKFKTTALVNSHDTAIKGLIGVLEKNNFNSSMLDALDFQYLDPSNPQRSNNVLTQEKIEKLFPKAKEKVDAETSK